MPTRHPAAHAASRLSGRAISLLGRRVSTAQAYGLLTALGGSLLIALTFSGSLAGFAAQVSNGANTVGTGALVMQETSSAGHAPVTCTSLDGAGASTNASVCSSIDKFGGSTTLVPGRAVSTSVVLTNVGSVPARTFTLAAGADCDQEAVAARPFPTAQPSGPAASWSGSASDLCSRLRVTIVSGATTVFDGTAASLAATASADLHLPPAPGVGVSVPFTFTVELDAAADDSYQGLSASLPLVWTFGS